MTIPIPTKRFPIPLGNSNAQLPTIIGLCVCVFGYLLCWTILRFVMGHFWFEAPNAIPLLVPWILTLIVLMITFFYEQAGIHSVGVKSITFADAKWGVIFLGIAIAAILAVHSLIGRFSAGPLQVLLMLQESPIGYRLLVALTAGITEEILFRGYVIERLKELSGSLLFASFLSWLLFTALHLPLWGVDGTVYIACFGVLMTVLYAIRRNVILCVAVHGINDILWFVLLPPNFLVGLNDFLVT